MSDTPRTDDAQAHLVSIADFAEFARTMERRIAALEAERQDLLPMVDAFEKATIRIAALEAERDRLLDWAVARWHAEVAGRPLVNVHRRTLDDTWRQVIRYAGGDPVELLGPAHDDLLAVEKEP